MRLTLRTLLAYLDDILDPADAAELRRKIEDSDFAKGLVHRLQSANSRSRLGAPSVDGKGMGLDPNTVAEYLDNVLPPDRIPDLERICLESDIHLAEVASCHQILAIVLGEAADVDPGLRERIYRIGAPDTSRTAASAISPAELNGAQAVRPGRSGAEGPVLGGMYDPPPVPVVPPPIESQSDAPMPAVRKTRADVPEYLRAGQRSNWKPMVVTLLLAFLLSAVALRAMGPFDRDHPLLRLVGGSAVQVADGDTRQNGFNEETEPADVSRHADSPLPEDAPRQSDAEVKPPKTKPAPSSAEAPADADHAPDGSKPANGAATAPAGPEDVRPPVAPIDEPTEPGFPETQPHPAPVAGGVDAEMEKQPVPADLDPQDPASEVVIGQPVEVGYVKIKDLQFPVRFDPKTQDWYRLPARSKLFSGDHLRILPTFHPEIVLTPGVQIVFAGPSSIYLTPPTPQGEPTLSMHYGRAFVAMAGVPGARLHLNLGGRQCAVTFLDAASEIALETRNFLPLGAHPERDATLRVIRVFTTIGRIEWQDDERSSPVPVVEGQVRVLVDGNAETLAAGDVPSWILREDLREIDRSASMILESFLVADRSITLSLRERAQDRRTEIRALAAMALAHLDSYEPLVAELDDARQRPHWAIEFEALRNAIARSPESAAAVRRDFEKRFPNTAEETYRLLAGYSPQQLLEGADETLVKLLDHPSLCVRVLAFENLRRITGLTLFYRPDVPEESRRASVRGWRERLNNRTILYGTLPEATSDGW
jgi:hypothetical protein